MVNQNRVHLGTGKIQWPVFGRLINKLDKYIAEVAAAHLDSTAAILRMARVDLIARANGISEKDLGAFLAVLENEQQVSRMKETSLPLEKQRDSKTKLVKQRQNSRGVGTIH